MYNNGEIVAQNYTKAVELFTKACDGGHTVGCNNLGVSYHEGKGVVQNDTKAIELFTKACNGGDELGCNNLKNIQAKSMDIQCVSACKMAMNTLISLGAIENPQEWLEDCWERENCFR
jgi:TPR repeat protein